MTDLICKHCKSHLFQIVDNDASPKDSFVAICADCGITIALIEKHEIDYYENAEVEE